VRASRLPSAFNAPAIVYVSAVVTALWSCLLSGCDDSRTVIEPDSDSPSRNAGGRTESASTPSAPHPNDFRFDDVTEESGVDFTYRTGREAGRFSILESLGGGVGVIDFDEDWNPDLYFPGGGTLSPGPDESPAGRPGGLFRNRGEFQFDSRSVEAGLAGAPVYTHGAFVADFNNDGFDDVLLTGFGGLQLFRNCGDGTFVDTAQQAGLLDDRWSSAAAWADFNADGALDLYVGHYVNWSVENDPVCPGPPPENRDVCPPRAFEGLDDQLYLSTGDGHFVDRTPELHLAAGGKCLGAVAADINLDGDTDIYVANDTTRNFLYSNQAADLNATTVAGGPAEADEPVGSNDLGFSLVERGVPAGVAFDDRATANGSMGVEIFDFDQDGRTDICVTNYEAELNALYRGTGNGLFSFASHVAGISRTSDLRVGCGIRAADFDADGDDDLVISNGHVIRYPVNSPVRQKPLLLENQSGRFVQVTSTSAGDYFRQSHRGRAVATADIDQDGDLDLIFAHCDQPAVLLRNSAANAPRRLCVRLVGRRSNRNAIGAHVTLTTNRARRMQHVASGRGYLSSSSNLLHWPLPENEEAKSLTVTWPTGRKSTINVSASGEPSIQILVEPDENSESTGSPPDM